MIEDYVEMIQNTSYDRSGANSLCYLFDDKVLLYEAICVDDIDELIKIINQYYHDGINIPRIIDYKFDSSKEAEKYDKRYHYGWVLEERAKGEELKRNTDFTIRLTDIEDFDNEYVRYTEECNEYLKYVQKMSEIDMSQLDKFVADFMRIQEEDLIVIDPSKPSNFFYDSEIGFSFIDLNLSNGHNPYNSKEYTAQYVIVNLYPFVPRLEFVEKGVDLKGRLILDSIYFTREYAAAIDYYQSVLKEKLLIIFEKYDVNIPQIEKYFDDCFLKNSYAYDSHLLNDGEELYDVLEKKLEEVVSSNKKDRRGRKQ